jgi:hypothetical protein
MSKETPNGIPGSAENVYETKETAFEAAVAAASLALRQGA